MRILIELRLCSFPTNKQSNNNNKSRIEQFINGLNKFFEYNLHYSKNNSNYSNIDIFVTDNTIPNGETLPDEILNVIPENIKIITCSNNNYGCFNKGAGDIEQWLYNREFIKQYDWFIHFEPRQLLKSNQFINSFLENPRNLFTLGNDNEHFNTGLFCIQTNHLLNYSEKCVLKHMVSEYISIEHDLFDYFKHNNIDYDNLEKMDLLWFDTNTNRHYHW